MGPSRGPQSSPTSRPAVPWFLRSRGRLLVTLLAVLVIPFAILNFAVVKRVRGAIAERERAKNQAVAGLAADAVGAHFEGLVVYVEGFAARPALRAALEAQSVAEVQDLLRELVQKSRNLKRAFIADAEGYERYDWPNDAAVIGQRFAHRDWYKGVVAAKTTYVSEIYERAAAPKCDVLSLALIDLFEQVDGDDLGRKQLRPRVGVRWRRCRRWLRPPSGWVYGLFAAC